MARRARPIQWTGLIAILLLVAVAAIFLPRHFRDRAKQQRQSAATAQHQRQPPRQPSVLEATRDSLEAEREWNAVLSDSLDTMYGWFREAYVGRSQAKESLAVFMAASDSLATLTASLQTKLDHAAWLAWTLAHGKEIAVRKHKPSKPVAMRTRQTELPTPPSRRPFINRRGGDINALVRTGFTPTGTQVPEGTTYQRGTYGGSQVAPPSGQVPLTPPDAEPAQAVSPTTPTIRGLSDQAANVERNTVFPLKPAWDPNDPKFRNRTRKDPVAVAKSGDGQYTVAVLLKVISDEGNVRMGLVKNGRMSTERDKTIAGERIGTSNVVVFGPFKGPGAIVRVNFPVYKPSDVHGPDLWAQFFWDDGRKKFPYVIQGDNDGIVIDFRQ